MKHPNFDDIIRQIALERDIELIDLKVQPNKYSNEDYINSKYVNRSCIIGRDEIILGRYDDEELRIASFFHEVGHTLIPKGFGERTNYSVCEAENEAWIQGFELAKKYNIYFSDKVYEWAKEQVDTYINYK